MLLHGLQGSSGQPSHPSARQRQPATAGFSRGAIRDIPQGELSSRMKLWIGITDDDWFEFPSGRPDLDEVNFWQPSGSRAFRVLAPGEPFLFKLHAPNHLIARRRILRPVLRSTGRPRPGRLPGEERRRVARAGVRAGRNIIASIRAAPDPFQLRNTRTSGEGWGSDSARAPAFAYEPGHSPGEFRVVGVFVGSQGANNQQLNNQQPASRSLCKRIFCTKKRHAASARADA